MTSGFKPETNYYYAVAFYIEKDTKRTFAPIN